MKVNIGRWFRTYSHPLTLKCDNGEFRAMGIIVPQEQDISFTDYPQPSPTGMIEYNKYIAYFVYIGGMPSSNPTAIYDGLSSYTIEKMEFINLMDCWRAILKEESDE